MSTVSIQIDNHGQPFTVREMRKRLAQVLSKLNGDMTISFAFWARLENYEPKTLPGAVMGELARPEND